MFSHRVFRNLGLVVGAVAALNCGDYTRSTSPTQSTLLLPTRTVGASFTMVAGGSVARAVKWGSSHSRVDQSVSATVGPEGATLSLPGADFSMTIPAGALSAPTASQGLSTTASYGTAAGNGVRTAYLSQAKEQVGFDGAVSPAELEAATTYFYGDQPVAETHLWTLNHFSRYILISGAWVQVED